MLHDTVQLRLCTGEKTLSGDLPRKHIGFDAVGGGLRIVLTAEYNADPDSLLSALRHLDTGEIVSLAVLVQVKGAETTISEFNFARVVGKTLAITPLDFRSRIEGNECTDPVQIVLEPWPGL